VVDYLWNASDVPPNQNRDERALSRDGGLLSRPDRAALYLARLGLRIIKQWGARSLPAASGGAHLSDHPRLVPLLALVFRNSAQTHNLEAQSRLVEFISTQALPDMGDVVSELASFSEKVATALPADWSGLHPGHLLLPLRHRREYSFNDICHVTVRRSWFRKFLIFYPVVTLLPVLAGAHLYWSGRLIGSGQLRALFRPALHSVRRALPHQLAAAQHPRALPCRRGRNPGHRFALEGLKWGFVHFAKGMLLSNYTGVYGPLALVPLVLLWIYISWWVVLGGAEIANTIQKPAPA